MIELYPYQKELIQEIKKNLDSKSICVVAPCGSGKSIIQGTIAKQATEKGNIVLFLVHRQELCDQITETFKTLGVNMDLCKVGMVQTITRRLEKEKKPVIILTDENHHCLAKSYMKIYEYFHDSIKIGFTATPIRLGGKGLHPVYDKLIIGPQVRWLIENKFLSTYKLYSIKLADAKKLHIQSGDYKKNEVNELMEKNIIYGDTVKNYKLLADGKKTIVYCASIKASTETAAAFNESGINAVHLDAKTSKKDRGQAVQDFRDGEITVLCNVDLFGEGFDIPDCECVILLRPTKSLSLYIQQSMRSMRYKPEKEAIIIDHVGNCFEHGLPNTEHSWTLEDQEKKKKKNKDNEVEIKQCKKCFAVCEVTDRVCPFCGEEFIYEDRKEALKIEAELKEIKESDFKERLKHRPMNHYLKINKLAGLIDFQEAKNYKIGWLLYKLEERKIFLKMEFEDFVRIQKNNNYKFGWVLHKCEEFEVEIPEKYNTYRRYMK